MKKNGMLWGIIPGAGGGLYDYFIQIHIDAAFWQKLFEAGITALICGILGAIGKWIADKILKSK